MAKLSKAMGIMLKASVETLPGLREYSGGGLVYIYPLSIKTLDALVRRGLVAFEMGRVWAERDYPAGHFLTAQGYQIAYEVGYLAMYDAWASEIEAELNASVESAPQAFVDVWNELASTYPDDFQPVEPALTDVMLNPEPVWCSECGDIEASRGSLCAWCYQELYEVEHQPAVSEPVPLAGNAYRLEYKMAYSLLRRREWLEEQMMAVHPAWRSHIAYEYDRCQRGLDSIALVNPLAFASACISFSRSSDVDKYSDESWSIWYAGYSWQAAQYVKTYHPDQWARSLHDMVSSERDLVS